VLPIAVTTWDGTTLTVEGAATDVGEGSRSVACSPPSQAALTSSGALCPTGGDQYLYVGING